MLEFVESKICKELPQYLFVDRFVYLLIVNKNVHKVVALHLPSNNWGFVLILTILTFASSTANVKIVKNEYRVPFTWSSCLPEHDCSFH